MRERSALIIGGNGFIGRNLCKLLLTKNMKVYSFDLTLPQEEEEDITYLAGNFFDDDTLREIIKDKDVVYHAVSTINPGNSNEKYMQGYSKDFMQTVKLCAMLEQEKGKMIFLSSGGTVYGSQDVMPIKEDTLPTPINHYGNLKLCIENTIRTFNVQAHTNNLIARISNPYGPGQDYHKGVGFIDAAIKKVINKKPIEIWGNGKVVRDYIYIKDVCNMLYELSNYEGDEEVFNLSSGCGVSQNEVVDILRELCGDVEVIYKESRSVDVEKIVLDNTRIKKIYTKPLTDIKKGIEKYYQYLEILNFKE